MDNNPQNSPQPQLNAPEPVTPTEPVPVAPPEPANSPTFSTEPTPIQSPKKSKKKLIIILIIIAILLIGGGVTAVIMSQPKTVVKSDTNVPSNSPTSTTGSKLEKSEVPDTYVYSANEANVKFDISITRFHKLNKSYCHILSYYESNDTSKAKYIIAIHNNGKAADVKNEAINDFLLSKLTGWLYYESNIDDLKRINSETSSTRTINGFNTLRFEGNAILADINKVEYPVFSVGYTLSVGGVPLQVIGFVVDKAQSQVYKGMVEEDVDKIMGTISLIK